MANLNLERTPQTLAGAGPADASLPDNLPDILMVPGLNNSGPGHWQTIWEQSVPRARRVDLGLWADPHRNTWVSKLALAIGRAERPVVLVAHSLGCHVIAWWAEYEAAFNVHLRNAGPCPVVGALLVAPPDVEEHPADRRVTRFAPLPPSALPFPSIVVASRDDPFIGMAQARQVAQRWGSRFVDAGAIGHINARSGIGEWELGLSLLRQLAPESVPQQRASAPQQKPSVTPIKTTPLPAAMAPEAPLMHWE
jgi:predicted alpha/beta hydrolase family esterase